MSLKKMFSADAQRDYFGCTFFVYLAFVVFRLVDVLGGDITPFFVIISDVLLFGTFMGCTFQCGPQLHKLTKEMKFVGVFVLVTLASYASAFIAPFWATRFVFEAFLLLYMWKRRGTVIRVRGIVEV
ncbi:hypothetical protein LWC08_05255 [Desulfobaculum bizertense]|uniref:hypothetical protein n=1 Tax=Desulfobaculum bizertense TaxID=376490 RepID=UPI001F2D0021|nr:hypothetical protein [Desulfobaculum bizertense]UIJ38983.1 hypothetical protein LWC08_05255 [Desulfobaculum bizertense]